MAQVPGLELACRLLGALSGLLARRGRRRLCRCRFIRQLLGLGRQFRLLSLELLKHVLSRLSLGRLAELLQLSSILDEVVLLSLQFQDFLSQGLGLLGGGGQGGGQGVRVLLEHLRQGLVQFFLGLGPLFRRHVGFSDGGFHGGHQFRQPHFLDGHLIQVFRQVRGSKEFFKLLEQFLDQFDGNANVDVGLAGQQSALLRVVGEFGPPRHIVGGADGVGDGREGHVNCFVGSGKNEVREVARRGLGCAEVVADAVNALHQTIVKRLNFQQVAFQGAGVLFGGQEFLEDLLKRIADLFLFGRKQLLDIGGGAGVEFDREEVREALLRPVEVIRQVVERVQAERQALGPAKRQGAEVQNLVAEDGPSGFGVRWRQGNEDGLEFPAVGFHLQLSPRDAEVVLQRVLDGQPVIRLQAQVVLLGGENFGRRRLVRKHLQQIVGGLAREAVPVHDSQRPGALHLGPKVQTESTGGRPVGAGFRQVVCLLHGLAVHEHFDADQGLVEDGNDADSRAGRCAEFARGGFALGGGAAYVGGILVAGLDPRDGGRLDDGDAIVAGEGIARADAVPETLVDRRVRQDKARLLDARRGDASHRLGLLGTVRADLSQFGGADGVVGDNDLDVEAVALEQADVAGADRELVGGDVRQVQIGRYRARQQTRGLRGHQRHQDRQHQDCCAGGDEERPGGPQGDLASRLDAAGVAAGLLDQFRDEHLRATDLWHVAAQEEFDG